MPFTEGNTAGKGRPPGSTNKLTTSFKELVRKTYEALEKKGEEADSQLGMLKWAEKNPGEFYKIASKLIPTELNLNAQITEVTISKEIIQKPLKIIDITPSTSLPAANEGNSKA